MIQIYTPERFSFHPEQFEHCSFFPPIFGRLLPKQEHTLTWSSHRLHQTELSFRLNDGDSHSQYP